MKKSIVTTLGLAIAATASGLVIGLSTHSTARPPVDLVNRADVVTQTSQTPVAQPVPQPTETAPASTDKTVTTVSPTITTPPQASPASPVTVITYTQIAIEGSQDVDCKLTYSDGTLYQWHWQTHGLDNYGNKTTQTSGVCDQTAIGQAKV